MTLFAINYKTLALLAIVAGLVILCMGLWYVWNTQQLLSTEVCYLRNQHVAIQEQLKNVPEHTQRKHSHDEATDHSAFSTSQCVLSSEQCATSCLDDPTSSQEADAVLHRSYQMVNDVSDCLEDDARCDQVSSTTDDDDTADSEGDEDFDDDDQNVDRSELVDPLHSHTSQSSALYSKNGSSSSTSSSSNANVSSNLVVNTTASATTTAEEDTNHLVESILSNIVSESVEQQTLEKDATNVALTPADAAPTNDNTDDSANEDFLENSGNYTALANSLRKKTVVELKKMCADYKIGIKKGKTFLKKEELIGELVVKMPEQ